MIVEEEEVDTRSRTTYASDFNPTCTTLHTTSSLGSVTSFKVYQSEETKLVVNFNKITLLLDEGPYIENPNTTLIQSERIINLIDSSKEIVEKDPLLTPSFVNYLTNSRLNKILTILVVDSLLRQVDIWSSEMSNSEKAIWKMVESMVETVYHTANLFGITISAEVTLNIVETLNSLRIRTIHSLNDCVKDSILISNAKRQTNSTIFQFVDNNRFTYFLCRQRHKVANDTMLKVFNTVTPTPELFQYVETELVHAKSMAVAANCITDFAALSSNFNKVSKHTPEITAKFMKQVDSIYRSVIKFISLKSYENLERSAYRQITQDYYEICQTIDSGIVNGTKETIIQNSDLEPLLYRNENFRFHMENDSDIPDWVDEFYFRGNAEEAEEEEESQDDTEIEESLPDIRMPSAHKPRFKKLVKNFFKAKLGFHKSSSKSHFFHWKCNGY